MRTSLYVFLFSCCIFIIPITGLTQETDIKGSHDHSLVTRMPDFFIGQYEENEFDVGKFKTEDGTIEVEGHKYVIDYSLKSGITPTGKTQILQNYKNALEKIGAEILLKGSYYYVFKITNGDLETWIKVDPGNYDGKRYALTIVERTVLVQEVFADADAMKNGILNKGHIALYGIYFDSGKSVVKAESDKAINEIAKFLKENMDINLYIVGHTDSDGDLYSNMELSVERAHAVINVLVEQHQIDRSRLSPKGCGSLAPVSTNRTAEGKAKNRRVELVEKMN